MRPPLGGKRLLPCVYVQTHGETTFGREAFITCVYAQMHGKTTFGREALITCVYAQMHGETTFGRKALVTVGALVWTFACVSAHVHSHRRRGRHLVTTHSAFKWLLSCKKLEKKIVFKNHRETAISKIFKVVPVKEKVWGGAVVIFEEHPPSLPIFCQGPLAFN